VASSPHLSSAEFTTRGMMIDVLIGLAPVMAAAVFVFHWYAVIQVGLCVLSCLAAEAVFTRMRGKPMPLNDFSAAVTGVILGLSLHWRAPWYVAVIGSVVAIGLGKVVFGGLGANVFNPAMVGRAFVMLSFPEKLGASYYVISDAGLKVVTEATPLTAAKQTAADMASTPELWPLFVGTVNGSLGETSALAALVGGVYLCVRRSASWEIPVGTLLAALACAEAAHWIFPASPLTAPHHVVTGALALGAFFIATDPATSPLAPKGKFLFGVGIGVLVIVIRVFSGYPEGVMFAVLLMNATVPLINRWTIPRPLGGPTPAKP
jgi:electron transport complex protein RnfD